MPACTSCGHPGTASCISTMPLCAEWNYSFDCVQGTYGLHDGFVPATEGQCEEYEVKLGLWTPNVQTCSFCAGGHFPFV